MLEIPYPGNGGIQVSRLIWVLYTTPNGGIAHNPCLLPLERDRHDGFVQTLF